MRRNSARRRRSRGGGVATSTMQMTNVVKALEVNSLVPSWRKGATKPAQAGANLNAHHGIHPISRGSVCACART